MTESAEETTGKGSGAPGPQGDVANRPAQVLPVSLSPADEAELKEVDATIRKAVAEESEPWFVKAGEAGITVGLLSMILVLRLFAVSDWNWGVGASLAESFNVDDALAIILGTLFERPTLSGVILAVALPLGFFREYWMARHGLTKSRANNWFTLVALIATAYVLTRTFDLWWIFATAAVLTIVFVTFAKVSRAHQWHLHLSKVGTHLGIVVGIALLIVAATIDTPWMEQERIDTKTELINGYVLEASPGFLKVMTVEREILILPDSEVTGREIVRDE